jgi:hypothetical protein
LKKCFTAREPTYFVFCVPKSWDQIHEIKNIMSLEKAIQENTEAVLKLVAIFSRYLPPESVTHVTQVTAETPAAAAPAKEKKPKAEKPAAPVEEKQPEQVAAPEPHKVAVVEVTLADLQVEGKKLMDAGKQADLKALVTKLGSAKLSTLPVEKYGEAIAELKKLTAGL